MSIKKIIESVESNKKLPLYIKEGTFVRYKKSKTPSDSHHKSKGYQTIQHRFEKFYKPIDFHETSI